MSATKPFTYDHQLFVLGLKPAEAYMIPCDEWEQLRNDIRSVATGTPWVRQNVGSLFLGAALTEFVGIIVGSIYTGSRTAGIVAWVIVLGCLGVGSVLTTIAVMTDRRRGSQSESIAADMERIANRYERAASAGSLSGG